MICCLNSIDDHIKSTMELETEYVLYFIGVIFKRNSDKIGFNVYRRKTHANKYLDYLSNDCQSVTYSAMSSVFNRARAICDDCTPPNEIRHN